LDLARAQQYGLKPGDVRRAMASMISSLEVSDIHRDGKVWDVNIWTIPEARADVTNLRELLIDTPSGNRVRLEDVADVRIAPTPNIIERENLSRKIDVSLNVKNRDLGAVARDVEQAIQGVHFPLEYNAEVLGEYAARQAAQQRLVIVGLIAVLAIFFLLYSSFQNWRLTFLTFLTLPWAVVGGLLAAALAGGGMLSLGSLVGLLTVLGIATRNGIMMVSHFQHLEDQEGEPFGPGLVVRGARERLSPILMTALATGLALVPLAIAGHTPGHEIENPMAIVILGGLVTSTVLNLVVVPTLYLRFGSRDVLKLKPA
jgi:Cu/Ag efflux pump CusA